MTKKKTTNFFEAISKTKPASEKQIREAVRRLVAKMLKEQDEEENAEEAPEEDPNAIAKPEPTPEEEGLNSDYQSATDMFIRKIAQTTATPTTDDLIDMISQVVERFTTTSEERLNLLKGVRSNTIR